MNAFAAQVWAAARAEADKVIDADRRQLEKLRQEYEEEAAAAWSEVDRLQGEIERLQGAFREARGRGRPVSKDVATEARRGLQPILVRPSGDGSDAEIEAVLQPLEAAWAEERDANSASGQVEAAVPAAGRYWDKAMGAAVATLAASRGATLSAVEILGRLRSGKDGKRYAGLDAALLAERMRDCASAGRLFRVTPNGRFALRGGSGEA